MVELDMSRETVVLSFDPGITTGFCAMHLTGHIIQSLEFTESLLRSFLESTPYWSSIPLRKYRYVVIELTPPATLSKMNRRLGKIVQAIDSSFDNTLIVGPGVWKTNKEYCQQVPGSYERHEKDAALLARYYIQRKFKIRALCHLCHHLGECSRV